MDFDTWHHLLLLRPLFAFVLACPLIIAAVFAGRSRDKRGAEAKQTAEGKRVASDGKYPLSCRYEVASSARHTANEWEIRRLTEIKAHRNPRHSLIEALEKCGRIFTRSLYRKLTHFTES
jgi:hypothetical protein